MVKNNLPKELLDFKILINPTRLAIMSILILEFRKPAAEIRNILGLTWGSFHSHVKTLVNENYISTQRDFIGSKPVVMLSLERMGAFKYRQFKKIWDSISNL